MLLILFFLYGKDSGREDSNYKNINSRVVNIALMISSRDDGDENKISEKLFSEKYDIWRLIASLACFLYIGCRLFAANGLFFELIQRKTVNFTGEKICQYLLKMKIKIINVFVSYRN